MRQNERVDHITTREDFVTFVRRLVNSLEENPADWENRDLRAFLEAMAAWVEDMDGYYENRGEPIPQQLDWKTLGQILLAARIYE